MTGMAIRKPGRKGAIFRFPLPLISRWCLRHTSLGGLFKLTGWATILVKKFFPKLGHHRWLRAAEGDEDSHNSRLRTLEGRNNHDHNFLPPPAVGVKKLLKAKKFGLRTMKFFFVCLLSHIGIVALLSTPVVVASQLGGRQDPRPLLPPPQLNDDNTRARSHYDHDIWGNLVQEQETPLFERELMPLTKPPKKSPVVKVSSALRSGQRTTTGARTAGKPQRGPRPKLPKTKPGATVVLVPNPPQTPTPKPTPNPPTLRPTGTFDTLSMDEKYLACLQHYRFVVARGKGGSSSSKGASTGSSLKGASGGPGSKGSSNNEGWNGGKGGKSGSAKDDGVVGGITEVRPA